MISNMTGSIDRKVTPVSGTAQGKRGLLARPRGRAAFAIMALLTGVLRSGPQDMLCSGRDVSSLSGMVPMYLLMSAFHLAPWLKLVSSRRIGARSA